MPIHYERCDGIATFTIDRPPVNAFTPALYKELLDRLKDFMADHEVRVGILTGAGTRAFSAGHDLKNPRPDWSKQEIAERHLRALNESDISDYPNWEHEVMRLTRFKPIVGAVNGAAMGQGLMFLLHLTELRVAGRSTRFGLPEIRYGMGGAGGTLQLGNQIPPTAALWLCLTGESFDAQQALQYHLVNEVVADDEVMTRAREIAALIAAHPPTAVRVEMESYYRARDMTREQAVAFSQHLFRLQRIATDTGKPIDIRRG
jgi:enoyl-CoA hydratase/carnithine racemase